ncbi:lef1 [Oxyplax ochracea nucleopolyhedrovirus]|uniref:Lef1 n=1 Tax=Oxyplax ochracea nucleopolyhedrovirus TaxID=2083176 RepID=A0A2L0WU75_9ABAC|nr:lef1 [Oxyplax ochracea nucleopolyhedrovirus]AVA31194.1 lef1 [Oxyplax ochracea nucleopolyhedrovirus]
MPNYTIERVNLMWNAVAYNDSRRFCFLTTTSRWIHPKTYFNNALELHSFILKNKVSDVHVKPLDDGNREWIIDADYKNFTSKEDLMLKINIGATAFLFFYTPLNVSQILFSGNRGFHIWLKFTDTFKLSSNKEVRENRYKVFVKPNKLDVNNIKPGSFAYCVRKAVSVYIDKIPKTDVTDLCQLTLLYWPEVDREIFCYSSKQIRAPFSYNCKGSKFSRCILNELIEKIQCFHGYGTCINSLL